MYKSQTLNSEICSYFSVRKLFLRASILLSSRNFILVILELLILSPGLLGSYVMPSHWWCGIEMGRCLSLVVTWPCWYLLRSPKSALDLHHWSTYVNCYTIPCSKSGVGMFLITSVPLLNA